MGIIARPTENHLIPIHPENATTKDWAILLEAGTIVGPSPERIRVAQSVQEKKIVKKHDFFLRTKYFIVVEGFNPRIHSLFFCPQLYRYDPEKKLVPLQGDEIGRLIAQAAEHGVTPRRPWYEPSEKLPEQPPIDAAVLNEFDTVVVDMPGARSANTTGPSPVVAQLPRPKDNS